MLPNPFHTILRIIVIIQIVVGIQLPAGLRRYATEISGVLEGAGYSVVFSGDPSYGACDVADEDMAAAGADVLVHFGHSKMMETSSIPVVYWEVRDSIDPVPALRANLSLIKGLGTRVGVVTTVQHVHMIDAALDYLRSEGLDAKAGGPGSRVSYRGQVLGCSFETAHRVDADFYVFVGTGRFHPLGISFGTQKPVVACEPYSQECEVISAYESPLFRKRIAMIEKARQCENFGIVVSTKRGQYRRRDAESVRKILSDEGKGCQLIFTKEISPSMLMDFDFDAYVIAACPRIAIDDAGLFETPVLTVKEAHIMAKGGEYMFDEIDNL